MQLHLDVEKYTHLTYKMVHVKNPVHTVDLCEATRIHWKTSCREKNAKHDDALSYNNQEYIFNAYTLEQYLNVL